MRLSKNMGFMLAIGLLGMTLRAAPATIDPGKERIVGSYATEDPYFATLFEHMSESLPSTYSVAISWQGELKEHFVECDAEPIEDELLKISCQKDEVELSGAVHFDNEGFHRGHLLWRDGLSKRHFNVGNYIAGPGAQDDGLVMPDSGEVMRAKFASSRQYILDIVEYPLENDEKTYFMKVSPLGTDRSVYFLRNCEGVPPFGDHWALHCADAKESKIFVSHEVWRTGFIIDRAYLTYKRVHERHKMHFYLRDRNSTTSCEPGGCINLGIRSTSE